MGLISWSGILKRSKHHCPRAISTPKTHPARREGRATLMLAEFLAEKVIQGGRLETGI